MCPRRNAFRIDTRHSYFVLLHVYVWLRASLCAGLTNAGLHAHTQRLASSRAHIRGGAYTSETMHVTKFALVCKVYETSPLLAAGHEMPAYDRSEKSWRSRREGPASRGEPTDTQHIFRVLEKSRVAVPRLFRGSQILTVNERLTSCRRPLIATNHVSEAPSPLHFTSPN